MTKESKSGNNTQVRIGILVKSIYWGRKLYLNKHLSQNNRLSSLKVLIGCGLPVKKFMLTTSTELYISHKF